MSFCVLDKKHFQLWWFVNSAEEKKKKRKEERTFSFLEFLPVDGRRHSIIGQHRSKDSLTRVSMTRGRIYILVQHHQNLNGIINNPKPMTSLPRFLLISLRYLYIIIFVSWWSTNMGNNGTQVVPSQCVASQPGIMGLKSVFSRPVHFNFLSTSYSFYSRVTREEV